VKKIYLILEDDEGNFEQCLVIGKNMDKIKAQITFNFIAQFIQDEGFQISGSA